MREQQCNATSSGIGRWKGFLVKGIYVGTPSNGRFTTGFKLYL